MRGSSAATALGPFSVAVLTVSSIEWRCFVLHLLQHGIVKLL